MYAYDFEKEPAVLCDSCTTRHSPDDDCPDDGLCVLSGCGKRATKSLFSDDAFQYCAVHFVGQRLADNE
jgi:hypothetical protein